MATRTGRSRGRGRVSSAPKRATEWFDTAVAETDLTAGLQVLLNMTTNLSDIVRKGSTILRILIDLNMRSVTGNVLAGIGLGLVLMQIDAFVAGSPPDPLDDDEQPGWMWRDQQTVVMANVNDQSQTKTFKLDLRAKRKFPGEDSLLVLVIERDAPVATLELHGHIRTLVLKP